MSNTSQSVLRVTESGCGVSNMSQVVFRVTREKLWCESRLVLVFMWSCHVHVHVGQVRVNGVRPQVASHRVPFIGVEVMHVWESCYGSHVWCVRVFMSSWCSF